VNETIPTEIHAECIRQQQKMGWPESVPAFAEFPAADGRKLWCHYRDLTVSLCEQLVEFHSRKARTAIATWHKTKSTNARARAGKNIIYARLYRCRYLSLMGIEDSTEDDMPFPFGRIEEFN
jgi:hypothetical protein